MENEQRCIYAHICKINGKAYIGQTKHQNNLNRRFYTDGSGYKPQKGKNSKFWNAIKKYGWENFEHIILEKDITTLELANEREKYWIEYYDSFYHGYNSTKGGDGTVGRKLSDEEKEYRSMLYKGKGNPMYGRKGELSPNYKVPKSDETKRKISKSHIGIRCSEDTKKKLSELRTGKYMGKDNPFYGRHHSDDVKRKLSMMATERMKEFPIYQYERTNSVRNKISNSLKEYYKTHDNPRKGTTWDDEHKNYMSELKKNDLDAMKRIVKLGHENAIWVNQYDLSGKYIATYHSILEAEEKTGAKHSVIIRCCKMYKNSKTSGGSQWRYYNEYSDCKDIEPVEYNVKTLGRKVCQFDKNMNLIKVWNSISEAAKALNIHASGISVVCNHGKQQTCAGYIWRYADEVENNSTVEAV